MPVCRDEMEIASACVRDVVVSTEALLGFLVSRGLNILETLDVDEMMLEVSLRSFELPALRRLVARRKKLATPEATELLELMEGERWTSTWKFDNGRAEPVTIGQGWTKVDNFTVFAHVCFLESSRSHVGGVQQREQQKLLLAQLRC
jgi:hypothetical protein